MKKLLFKIKDNSLIVKEKNKLNNEYKNLLNTNVISANELIFSDEYLKNNYKIVGSFLKELTNDYKIDTIVICKNEYAGLIIDVLKNNKDIINLILKEDEQLTFSLCEKIVKTGIKNINCYNLQPFMIEYLDKYGCLIESRNEILFLSNFMIENNLSIFSSLFYKMTLNINLPMSNQDEEDFNAFCKINKYLKTINVNTVNKNDLESIIDILRKSNKKNVKIVIHDNIDDEATIEYLKNYNKKKSKKYKIYFKLVYSDEYLKNNLVKQTNYSILKLCGTIIILIIAFTFGHIFYDNYTSTQSVTEMQEDLKEVISINDDKTTEVIEKLNSQKDSEEKKVINEDIVNLYNINPDTVGWIKVPNTNIDYAVTQSVNNKYYLNHNFYLKEDKNGWIFMDYRDDVENLSDNIILYGHNRYYSGIMFGPMLNMLKKSWYSKEENQIITLKTMYETLEYKIFSMYKIAVTTDYLKVIFDSYDTKQDFYDMLKDRSIHDFDVDITGNDKILTLSTCADENNRYVVHAVLINKESSESN